MFIHIYIYWHACTNLGLWSCCSQCVFQAINFKPFLLRRVVSGDLFELTVDHLDSVNGGSCGQIIFRTQSRRREMAHTTAHRSCTSHSALHRVAWHMQIHAAFYRGLMNSSAVFCYQEWLHDDWHSKPASSKALLGFDTVGLGADGWKPLVGSKPSCTVRELVKNPKALGPGSLKFLF